MANHNQAIDSESCGGWQHRRCGNTDSYVAVSSVCLGVKCEGRLKKKKKIPVNFKTRKSKL